MSVALKIENESFAPFDLAKTRKFNRKTDKDELAVNTYKLANEYFDAATILFKDFRFISVVLSNIAFSCELYLKALLYGCGIEFGNTHGLKNLFQKLPDDIKKYVSQNIVMDNREAEFEKSLSEQNEAFVVYRYINEAKAISADPLFLFAFAHILKFIYETLSMEQDKGIIQEDI